MAKLIQGTVDNMLKFILLFFQKIQLTKDVTFLNHHVHLQGSGKSHWTHNVTLDNKLKE